MYLAWRRGGGGKKEKEGGEMKDGEHLIYDVQLPSSDNSPAFLIFQGAQYEGWEGEPMKQSQNGVIKH